MATARAEDSPAAPAVVVIRSKNIIKNKIFDLILSTGKQILLQ